MSRSPLLCWPVRHLNFVLRSTRTPSWQVAILLLLSLREILVRSHSPVRQRSVLSLFVRTELLVILLRKTLEIDILGQIQVRLVVRNDFTWLLNHCLLVLFVPEFDRPREVPKLLCLVSEVSRERLVILGRVKLIRTFRFQREFCVLGGHVVLVRVRRNRALPRLVPESAGGETQILVLHLLSAVDFARHAVILRNSKQRLI